MTLHETKELQNGRCIYRRDVLSVCLTVPNNLRPIAIHNLGEPRRGGVSNVLRERNIMDRAPLFELLVEIGVVDDEVRSAVPNLEQRKVRLICWLNGNGMTVIIAINHEDVPASLASSRCSQSRHCGLAQPTQHLSF